MSCCNHDSEHCICKTLKKIDNAQSSNREKSTTDCHDFNSPMGIRPHFNTIPIMLLCKGTCDFFIGSGVFMDDEAIECFKTPVFRVSRVIEEPHEDSCCVELELLQPQGKHGDVPPCKKDDVCSFFHDKKIEKFVRTGIFIKVDVSCFCGIECLPAVKAHHGKPVPCRPQKKEKVVKEEKIIKEEICGNFGPGTQTVWETTSEDILQGTFEIFNSAHSPVPVEGFVNAKRNVTFPPVLPGSAIVRSTISPTSFTIEAPAGTSGKFCITLTKSIRFKHHFKDCDD